MECLQINQSLHEYKYVCSEPIMKKAVTAAAGTIWLCSWIGNVHFGGKFKLKCVTYQVQISVKWLRIKRKHAMICIYCFKVSSCSSKYFQITWMQFKELVYGYLYLKMGNVVLSYRLQLTKLHLSYLLLCVRWWAVLPMRCIVPRQLEVAPSPTKQVKQTKLFNW